MTVSQERQLLRNNNKPSSDEIGNVQEIPWTQNIFELLSCDLQLYLLTFLEIKDLYSISLSGHHGAYLVLSTDSDGYLWKSMALNQFGLTNNEMNASLLASHSASFSEEAEENTVENNSWRNLIRTSMIQWEPESRTPDTDLKLRNNNKTISCERTSKWDTIRANRKLEMGGVYCWEYTLDDHDNGSYNAYRIFVGIETSKYEYTTVDRDKIIGLGSEGVGYNIGIHTVNMNRVRATATSILSEQNFVFSSGDTIVIKFDLKNLRGSSKTASMYLFKNNEYFHTIEGIQTQGIVYYPAISVIGHQRVSIRMKDSSQFKHPQVKIGSY